MVLYGLIGYPLTHSWSEEFFSRKFSGMGLHDRQYTLFPLNDISVFPQFIAGHPDLHGLNITIPWKEKIIPFLDELDETALKIGAVNTILITGNNQEIKLKGFNTDAAGFERSMDFTGFGKAMVLGTGGSGKAVSYVLNKLGIIVTSVSRNPLPGEIQYSEITGEVIREHTLIINTTPLGMYPETDAFPPLPYHLLTPSHFLYDLIYNPKTTLFLKKGADMGARVRNGLGMLELQAEAAWEIWQDAGYRIQDEGG